MRSRISGTALLLIASLLISEVALSDSVAKSAVIGPSKFASTLPPSETEKIVDIAAYQLDVVPVSNARFLRFVKKHSEWQRDKASKLFIDEKYLSHWQSATQLKNGDHQDQPVVNVSWFAANAFCEAQGGRLPSWYEWELAAAASSSEADARENSEWRQQILNWYARSSAAKELPAVGQSPQNFYGVQDLHGLVWEWVEDYNGMLVGTDNREQGGADKLKFCGAGALTMEQKENYATLMRVALLSSLEARYTTQNLGFRCAYDIDEGNK